MRAMRCHCAKQPLVYLTRQIFTFSRHAGHARFSHFQDTPGIEPRFSKKNRRLFEEWEKSSVKKRQVWDSSPRAPPWARFESNVLTTRLTHHMGGDHNRLCRTLFVTCHRMSQKGVWHNRLWYFHRLWSPENLKSPKSYIAKPVLLFLLC